MKALVGAFNQENALVGAFSVIVQLHRLIDLRHYYLLISTAAGTIPLSTQWQSSRGHMQDVHLYTLCIEIVSVNKTLQSEVMSLHFF